jgi:hypothetical protein
MVYLAFERDTFESQRASCHLRIGGNVLVYGVEGGMPQEKGYSIGIHASF